MLGDIVFFEVGIDDIGVLLDSRAGTQPGIFNIAALGDPGRGGQVGVYGDAGIRVERGVASGGGKGGSRQVEVFLKNTFTPFRKLHEDAGGALSGIVFDIFF